MARVSLDPAGLRLEAMPEGAVLLPGMTLGAEVRTGTRSILDYFIDPLLRGFNERLREP
jgi:HlyD family secretion protein